MKWIEVNKGEYPKEGSEDMLVLFETGEWRRFMEEDLPAEIITHYMFVPSLEETENQ